MAQPPPTSSSPEIDLLCALVRPQPDLPRARALLRGLIDFPVFVELAQVHAVRPRLIQALSALDWEGIPLTAKREFEAFRERHVLRSLYLAEQQGLIADAFLADGICFAFFKGATLAADLYGDLSWREYGDIDVIVMPHQVAGAERVLEDLGYLNRQGDPAFRRAFLASQRQYTFTRPDIGATVDLHWDFSAGELPFPLRPQEAWGTLKGVRVGARNMPTVSDENLALLLAGHGTKEAWRSLGWVCDFAIFMESAPGLDWAALLARARRRGSGNSILLGCAMARELLGTAVPPALIRPLAGNRRVGRLADRLIERLWRGLEALPRPTALMDIDLCDRRRDRVTAMLRVALTPTPGDYHAFPLPAGLWGLYYLLRPLRLAARLVIPRRSPRDDQSGDDRPEAAIGRPAPQHQTT